MLILLIILLALAGGFLGDLLEFAFWVIVVLAALGALAGYALHRAISGFSRRSASRPD